MDAILDFATFALLIGLGYFIVYKAFTVKLKKFETDVNMNGFKIVCEYDDPETQTGK